MSKASPTGCPMSSSDGSFDRRKFLRGSLGTLPVALGAGLVAGPPAVAAAVHDYQPKFFTADEWQFLCAAVDRLIPPDAEGPGAVEAGVPEFIDRQMDTPYAQGALWYMQGPYYEVRPELGYQMKFTPRDIYRIGIAASDRWVQAMRGKRFAALDGATQDGLLAQMEDGRAELHDIPS